jgi:hypothetical protein
LRERRLEQSGSVLRPANTNQDRMDAYNAPKIQAFQNRQRERMEDRQYAQDSAKYRQQYAQRQAKPLVNAGQQLLANKVPPTSGKI